MDNVVKNKIADAIVHRMTALTFGTSIVEAQIRSVARDLANEIDGIVEASQREIRIKHISSMCSNVSYIIRSPKGNVYCVLDNGTPAALGYGGIHHDEQGAKIALSKISDPKKFLAKLRELSTLGPSGRPQYREGRYELV